MGRKNRYADIAVERIDILFEQARTAASAGKQERADRYVEIARNIAMRFSMSLPTQYQRKICSGCSAYLHANNSRTRLTDGKKIVTCLSCDTIHRYPYKD